MNQFVPVLAAAAPHTASTWPIVAEHALHDTTTVPVLALYLAYLAWVKPRIAKSTAGGKTGLFLNNLGDIVFLLILVPKIADHVMGIVKAFFV